VPEKISVAGIPVEVHRKRIKNLHLSVYPPFGAVKLSAPESLDLEALRLFALNKLPWIRESQRALRLQAREAEREFVERESHYLWGKRYLLQIEEADAAPKVILRHSKIILQTRPGSSRETRAEVIAAWHRQQLREHATPLIDKWSRTLGVSCSGLFVQQMKTRWGSCNPKSRSIRLNTQLATKPPACLEYVVVHELAHIIDPNHGKVFLELLNSNLPGWPGLHEQLNQSALAHVEWVGQTA
jgi:predicted metal-dependent hydrolase